MNKMSRRKKILASTLVGLAVFFSGANVFATSVLDTNVISLINQSVDHISKPFMAKAMPDMVILLEEKKKDITQYVNERTDDVLQELSNSHADEKRQAEEAIENHYNHLIQSAENVFVEETEKIKEEIKGNFQQEVNSSKRSLEAELEKALNEKLQNLTGAK